MFPREMSLHDKEEVIRKPLKHYFLSVSTATNLLLQLHTHTHFMPSLCPGLHLLQNFSSVRGKIIKGAGVFGVTFNPDIWQPSSFVRVCQTIGPLSLTHSVSWVSTTTGHHPDQPTDKQTVLLLWRSHWLQVRVGLGNRTALPCCPITLGINKNWKGSKALSSNLNNKTSSASDINKTAETITNTNLNVNSLDKYY